jgi:hypothetical protein
MNFLESYVRRTGDELSNSVSITKNNKCLIDHLLNEKISKAKIEYLIKWIRYPDYKNIWKSLQNLDGCELAIHNFRIRKINEMGTKRVRKARKGYRKCS